MLLLFLSSFLAATFIPLSSEVYFALVIDDINIFTAVLIATAGNSLGSFFTYYLGWLAKWEWIEKALRTSKKKVEDFKSKIEKYGSLMGLLCWTPIIGDVIAISLGFFRVEPSKTFTLIIIGKALRYIIIGYLII